MSVPPSHSPGTYFSDASVTPTQSILPSSPMPYVDLVSRDDYVSIWYTTNSRHNCVGTFDSTKPTIILLHPFSLDSSWLGHALGNPRLNEDYNMIAFDLRFSGKTIERPNARLDCWVQAADLAFACEALHVSRAHLWAEETISVNIALRFAMLFPEMCLSLALVTVSSPSERRQDISLALDQAIRLWCFAEDLDTLNHAATRFLELTAGADLDIDEIHQIVAFWQTQYPPLRHTRIYGIKNSILNVSLLGLSSSFNTEASKHVPLTKSQLATIYQPVLILHGENNPTHPLKYAKQLREDLVNSKAMLSVIKGAAGFMGIISSSAPALHQTYVDFLGGLPSPPSDPTDPDFMRRALGRLAELAADPSIASRSLKSPMSFSLVSYGVGQSKDLNVLMQETNTGFSLFPPDRRSLAERKFFERTKGLFHRRSDSRLHIREGSLP
ncbi:alpha/beta-hydrolase [Lactarius hatsudake]|nr:alpha/beta-hydrolase [Lactarius hatsudake]